MRLRTNTRGSAAGPSWSEAGSHSVEPSRAVDASSTPGPGRVACQAACPINSASGDW